MIAPYSKYTTKTLWTDPHIAQKMLEHHLSAHDDIASRNHELIRDSVDFIINTFQPRTVLDIGCGPGLYTNLFQQKGITTYGLDFSSNSLAYAKSQNKEVTYILDSYIDYVHPEKVDLITFIYCDFGAMLPNDLTKTLRNVYDSLKDDGVFLFDVFSMNFFKKTKESYRTFTEIDGFYMKGTCHIKERVVMYPKLGLQLRHILAKGEKTHEFYNWDKCYDVDEMRILLLDNGFEIIDYFSNTNGEKNFVDNDLLVFACKKRKQSN